MRIPFVRPDLTRVSRAEARSVAQRRANAEQRPLILFTLRHDWAIDTHVEGVTQTIHDAEIVYPEPCHHGE